MKGHLSVLECCLYTQLLVFVHVVIVFCTIPILLLPFEHLAEKYLGCSKGPHKRLQDR